MIEETEIDTPIYDHKAIAREFVKAAIEDLNAARQRDHQEWMQEQEVLARLCDRERKSKLVKRSWASRKRKSVDVPVPNPDGWSTVWA